MKKLLISSAVALALFSSTLVAEESGAFVGAGLGLGGTKLKPTGEGAGITLNLNGFSYEIVAGYKQFFTPEFGLRYYANFAGLNTSVAVASINVYNYGVNVDALYNFVDKLIDEQPVSFGGFLGLGLGANTWGGNLIDVLPMMAEMAGGGKTTTTSFNLALNVGLRAEIMKHHDIELVARIPFIATTIYNVNGVKINASQTYNVGLRYIYSF